MYDESSSKFLKTSLRPLLEYAIILYYFIYFTILPRYILKNSKSIEYFFKVFCSIFFIVLIVGFGDLLIMKIITGYSGIPRHIGDCTLVGWRLTDCTTVGLRFHGLAGEPRDAFSFLMLGLSIIALRDIWSDSKSLNKFLIIIIFIAAILTQSASGLIGIFFTMILISIFLFRKQTLKKMFKLLILSILIILSIVIAASFSHHIMLYYHSLFGLLPALMERGQVEGTLSVTANNIYPLWQRWLELSEFKFLSTIFGTGLGSASVINNYFSNIKYEIINPNANIVRSIYETGIIGTYLLVNVFLSPIKKINLSKNEYLKISILMLLMLGMFFAHRSVIPFLFLGIVLAVFKQKSSGN